MGWHSRPNHIEVPVGDRLIIDFTNSGDQRHDLVFETGVTSGSLATGETKELDLGVISGDVEGWCSLPGHREMGMTLHVQATGASSGSSSSAGDHGLGRPRGAQPHRTRARPRPGRRRGARHPDGPDRLRGDHRRARPRCCRRPRTRPSVTTRSRSPSRP